jgi:ribosomal protein L23
MIHNITTPIEFSIEIESLYIAHVFPNIHKKKIAQLFEKLFLARIKGIDLVTKIGKDGKPYNSAYIHIDYWFDTSAAKHFQEKIRSDAKEALLVYDEPWYWIVNENKSTEKSKFIQKAEKEKFEGVQKQANNTLSEMLMMLDALEDIFDKHNEKIDAINEEYELVQYEYEYEDKESLSEQRFQEHKAEYLCK